MRLRKSQHFTWCHLGEKGRYWASNQFWWVTMYIYSLSQKCEAFCHAFFSFTITPFVLDIKISVRKVHYVRVKYAFTVIFLQCWCECLNVRNQVLKAALQEEHHKNNHWWKYLSWVFVLEFFMTSEHVWLAAVCIH